VRERETRKAEKNERENVKKETTTTDSLQVKNGEKREKKTQKRMRKKEGEKGWQDSGNLAKWIMGLQ